MSSQPCFPSASAPVVQSDWQDFVRGMNAQSVDLILTDPPYTISRNTGFAKVRNGVDRFAVSMDFGGWDHHKIDLPALCSESFRVLRKGGTAIIWYDLWKFSELAGAMAIAGYKMLRMITWQKTNPVPLNSRCTYLSNSREVAVCGVKGGKPTFNGCYDSGIYTLPIPRPKGGRIHPTQKPLNLFEELVCKHSCPGDLVVDPFLGSGTTAAAALAHGRRFAGCDVDQRYVEAAKARIDQVIALRSMHLASPPPITRWAICFWNWQSRTRTAFQSVSRWVNSWGDTAHCGWAMEAHGAAKTAPWASDSTSGERRRVAE